jgi:chorismate dehydratase
MVMRVGRIPWINCFPVYGAIDRGTVQLPARLITGTASELNDLLAAGELDVSVVSAVEYARNAAAYHLLPDLAISCDGPVHSVALFSRRPVSKLDGATVLLSQSSRTSVLLLQVLCRHRWRIQPRFAAARAEAQDLEGLARLPHDAVLVIGDAALLLRGAARYPYCIDMGEAWSSRYGRPAGRLPCRKSRRCTGSCWSPVAGACPTWTSWRPGPPGARAWVSRYAGSIWETWTTPCPIDTWPA